MINPVRYLKVIGTPDGGLLNFQTQHPYQIGSLRVLINGMFRKAELDDGFLELGGSDFRMKVAPKAGDTIWAFYNEA